MAVKAGEAFLDLAVRDSEFRAGLSGVLNKMRSFAVSFAAIGAGITALSGAVTATFGVAARTFAEFGQQLSHMSARTGIAADTLSALQYAADQSGVSIDSLDAIIRAMQRSLVSFGGGKKSVAAAFKVFGIEALALKHLAPEEQLITILDTLGNIKNPTVRAAAAMRIFGRSGTAILPLIGNWKALSAEAEHFNLVVSKESVERGQRLQSAFDLLGATFRALKFSVGDAIGDGLTHSIRMIAEVVASTIKWVKANQALLATTFRVGRVVLGMGVAVTLLAATLPVIAPAIEVLRAVVAGLAVPLNLAKVSLTALAGVASFILTPFGAVVAAVVAAGAAFIYFSGLGGKIVAFLGQKFAELSQVATQTFDAIGDALAGGDILAAANVLWAGLRLAWLQGTDGLTAAWFSFKNIAVLTFIELSANIQSIWAAMVSGLKSTWLEFKRFWIDAFDLIVARLAGIGETDAVKAQLQKDLDAKIIARELDSRAAQQAIQDEKKAKLDAIKTVLDAEREAQGWINDKGLRAAQSAVEKARKDFDEARRRAREARVKGFGGDLAGGGFDPNGAAGIAEAAKGLTRFTFSGKLAGQVFGAASDPVPKQHLAVAKKQRDLLQELRDKLPFNQFRVGNV